MQEAPHQLTWYLFRIRVSDLLVFLEERQGRPFSSVPPGQGEANRWHLALRTGLRRKLHLNLGLTGIEEPEDPIIENACALHAALLLGHEWIEVILSGEWDRAVREGLISPQQLRAHERAMRMAIVREVDGS
ncbi:MAG: hypothetical protein AB3N33_07450 [Puniceicoccaceae bacterium]